MAPNFGPSCGGPARPTALRTPTPTSGAWLSGDACGIVVAPAGALVAPAAAKYLLNRARRGVVGVVPLRHASSLVGVLRLRETH